MPLTEEEKQALREKYRKQRQAMWEGKRQPRGSSQDEVQSEQSEIASDNGSERPSGTASSPLDAQGSALAEGDSIGTPLATQSGPSVPSDPSDDTQARQYLAGAKEPPSHIHNVTVELIAPAEPPEASDSNLVEESAIPNNENRLHTVEADLISAEDAGRAHSRSTARVQLSRDGVTTYVKPSEIPKTGDNGQQIGKQIREQREKMWAKQASSRSREGPQQEAEQLSDSVDDEKDSGILNWKLVLGVVGTIIVLAGVGVLLGYWFAS